MTMSTKQAFTLLELTISMAIIAMLVTLAIPQYTHHKAKVHRAEAKLTLLHLSSRMETYYETHHTYEKAKLQDLIDQTALPDYALSLSNLSPSTYTLLARSVGRQKNQDPTCAVLVLNQLGEKGIGLNEGRVDIDFNSICW